MCKSKITPLEIPRLPEELSDSVEQTALTRATKTLLMNAMCEKVANEQEAQKNGESEVGEKKTKLMNEMFLMKQSELWKMMVGDRDRSLLKYESSQKGKDKAKGN